MCSSAHFSACPDTLKAFVRALGFEPRTFRVSVGRSSQLSYARTKASNLYTKWANTTRLDLLIQYEKQKTAESKSIAVV